jgi:transcription elongation factor GreA
MFTFVLLLAILFFVYALKTQVADIANAVNLNVKPGVVVTLLDQKNGSQSAYTVVTANDSNKANTLIVTSPLGLALLGKKIGEAVEVKSDKTTHHYIILNLEFNR